MFPLWKLTLACSINLMMVSGGLGAIAADLPAPASVPLSVPVADAPPEQIPPERISTTEVISSVIAPPESVNSQPESAQTAAILSTLAAKPLATQIRLEDVSAVATVAPLPMVSRPDGAGTALVAQAAAAAPKSLAVSQSAADLGGVMVKGFSGVSFLNLSNTLQLAESSSPTPANSTFKPSHALNLWSVRSLRKPVGKKVLDSGVSISGIQPRDTSESFWTRDYLTGNWGGARDWFYDHGVEFTFAVFIDVFGNVSGGRSQNTAYSSVNTISFDFYTDRLGLWPHGQIHWTNAWIDGANVSVARNYAGAFNSVFFADPPRRGLRLFELWYGHKFFDGQLDIRLGKIYPFVKIGISQAATAFQNSNFGYPGFIGTNRQFGYSTLYGAAPFGLEILYSPNNSPWFVQNMVMDGFDDPTAGPYPNNRNDNYRGLDLISLRGREGVEGILELGYKLNQEKGSIGLPGTYRAGFQWHTGEFESFTKDANGLIRRFPFASSRATRSGNYAFYVVGEQMLYRESADPKDRTQGLSGFLKGTVVPQGDVNTISFNVAGGLVYEGPFPGRDRDLIGIGIAHTGLSGGLKDLARNAIGFDPTVSKIPSGETALEFMYAAELAPWWVMIFSVQYIINPSFNAFENTPNATVIGISSRFGL